LGRDRLSVLGTIIQRIQGFFGDHSATGVSSAAGACLIVLGIPLIVSADMPWWWLGMGAAAAGAALLVTVCRERAGRNGWIGRCWRWLDRERAWGGDEWGVTFRASHLVGELVVLCVVAGLVVAMAPELVMGERPVSFDHPVHYMKAWRLEHEFLLDGRLRGWSHQWLAGYPAQYLYPIGADLLVVWVHALTFGLVTFSTAYAWALAIFWGLRGWAIYRFASIGVGRWGGLLAALLWMGDTAAARVGGWHFGMEVGVWPMTLAVVLGVWATAYLVKMVTARQPRYVAAFALLLGLAIWSHPFAVYHFALVGPVAVVAVWFADDVIPWAEAVGRIVVGYGVGIIVGLFWLLPFLTSTAEMDSNFGGRWMPMFEMGAQLYSGGLWAGTWVWVTVIGAMGVLICLVARRFHAILTGWLAVGCMVFASSDFLAAFHLLEWSQGLQTTHFKRFVAVLKPYWIVAAAYAVVSLVTYLAGRRASVSGDRSTSRLKVAVGCFLVVSALAPVAVGFLDAFASKHLNRDLQTVSERADQRDRDALAGWFQRHHPEGPYGEGPFFRVAYCCGYHDHSFVDFGQQLAYPLYKVGFSPATSFEHRVKSGDRRVLDAVNVRYMIARRPLNRPYLKRVKTFGRLHLYEIKQWNRQPFEILGDPGTDDGSNEQASNSTADVAIETFESERIVVDVPAGAVPDGGGKLRLNVSNFSRWRAWRGGEALSITETSAGSDTKTGFMTVGLEKGGEYVFEFQRAWSDWCAWLLGVVGLACLVWLVLADRRIGWSARQWRRASSWLKAVQQWGEPRSAVLVASSLLVAIGLAAALAWYTPAIDVEHVELPSSEIESVAFDAADQLSDAQVGRRSGGRFEACRQLFGRFMCAPALWKQPHVRIEDFGFKYDRYRCIWSHPVPNKSTEFVFRQVPAADGMMGWFGVAESGSQAGSPPVDFSVAVDGVTRYTASTEQDETLHGFELPLSKWVSDGQADIRFSVRADQTGMRHFCFNAQTVYYQNDAPHEKATKVPEIPRASGLRP
jgi:hypothetical protein